MSSIVIAGDTSGSVTLQAPAVSGSTTLNLPATSGTIQASGAGYTTNGVAYATSATGLVTGSALTFDGTKLEVYQVGLGASVLPFYAHRSNAGIVARFFNEGYGSSLDITSNASNNILLQAASGDALSFSANGNATSDMVIDTSGKLLVATTSVIDAARMTIKGSATVINAQTETDGSYVLRVTNAAGSGVGGVVANSSSTSYLTSSDYRLKNTIAPMTGALAKVTQLKPVTYKWNVDGSDGEGFIAHELAQVCPDAVTGEKDAIDADGNIKSQGIDTSFLVATLTAAIQEQQALITTLTERITALEGA